MPTSVFLHLKIKNIEFVKFTLMENIKTIFEFVPVRNDLGNSSTGDEFGHTKI